METASVTKAEAAKGDQQAVRKLASEAAAKGAERPEQAASSQNNFKRGFEALA